MKFYKHFDPEGKIPILLVGCQRDAPDALIYKEEEINALMKKHPNIKGYIPTTSGSYEDAAKVFVTALNLIPDSKTTGPPAAAKAGGGEGRCEVV